MTDTPAAQRPLPSPRPEERAIDPVCGMKVKIDGREEHDRARRTHLLLLQSQVPAEVHGRSGPLPEARRGRHPRRRSPPGTIFTCPMHPEIRQVGPGSCPICGMALEPAEVSLDDGPNEELVDMTRRLWIGGALAVPVVALDMGGHLFDLHRLLPHGMIGLAAAGAGDAGRAVGRLAVLRARLAVGAHRAISTCSR